MLLARARKADPFQVDLLVAIALSAAIALEALLGPAGEGSRLVSALAAPALAMPLAWRRRTPLAALVSVAVVLALQELLGGFLSGQSVALLAVLLLALYSAGRYVAGAPGTATAAAAIAGLIAIRLAFDPSVERAADVVGTLLVVPLPFVVGRAVRGQLALARALAERARRLSSERDRDARLAVEEERVRIARELQGLVAAEVTAIVAAAARLRARLASGDGSGAGEALATIADRARATLAEVRRALGILRRDGAEPDLAPLARGQGPDDPGVGPEPEEGSGPGVGRGIAPRVGAGTSRWGRSLADGDPRTLDRLLAGALLVAGMAELAVVAPSGWRPLASLMALPIALPLLWRRRGPIVVFVVVLGAVSAQSAMLDLDTIPVSSIAAIVCAAYAMGAHADGRAATAGLALAAAGVVAHAAVFYPDSVAHALVGGVVVPWTLGRILHNQRRLRDELEERAVRAEREREREIRGAVTAERTRVARELHDTVAHSLSVMAIHAAGAQRVADRDLDRAAAAAALIERVGRDALAEAGPLLELARAGEPATTATRSSLARIDELAARARQAGLPVQVQVEGTPAALPAGVDLAAYRIVQEALANASKHAGDARAQVLVRYGEGEIQLEISDDGPGPNGHRVGGGPPGQGLIGMRERAALYGGAFEAGSRSGGGFRIRARLPIGGA